MGLRGLSVSRRSNGNLASFKLTVSEILEIGELIAPLSDDSESIFEKCDHDEESPYSGKIANSSNASQPGFSGKWLQLKGQTHGFNGSPTLVNQSSILLVCSRI